MFYAFSAAKNKIKIVSCESKMKYAFDDFTQYLRKDAKPER